MLKAVLFDIDNTLILYDEARFLQSYFPMVAARFKDIIPSDRFADKLMQATLVMHQNDGSMTNRERFMGAFCQGTDWRWDDIWSRFENFYLEDWDKLKDEVKIPDHTSDVFRTIGLRGLKIVIATNPIFPHIAQMKKLEWAGLGDIDAALVTDIDNMSFCKPQLGYFRQICREIDENPEDCLMVGDDPANDMVSARIGMKTYMAVDSLSYVESPLEVSKHVIGSDTEGIPTPNFKGPLSRVPEAVDILSK
ncbi:MAG: HAD family hydrolase [Dehalococcoidia bacterium]|jgi:HAD superfamily hydrolase (TIGR01549 family)